MHDAPLLDFHVRRRLSASPDPSLSLFNRSSAQASARDAIFTYHVFSIDQPSRISVHVKLHDPSVSYGNNAHVHIQALRQGVRCPVILEEHQPRIVGGQAVNSDLKNYLAFITIPTLNGVRACSGTIVGPRLVITAAHCGVDMDSTVYIGGKQGNPSDGAKYAVESVQAHVDFSIGSEKRFRYDISVLTLVADVPESALFMKVNVNTSVPIDGSVVRAAGYGILRHEDEFSNPKSQLHQVDMPIVPRKTCEKAYDSRGLNIDYGFQLCAGYFNQGGCDSW